MIARLGIGQGAIYLNLILSWDLNHSLPWYSNLEFSVTFRQWRTATITSFYEVNYIDCLFWICLLQTYVSVLKNLSVWGVLVLLVQLLLHWDVGRRLGYYFAIHCNGLHWVVRQFSAKSGPPLVITCTMSQPAQQCNWATRRNPQVDVGPLLPTTSIARTLASTMQLGRQERSTPSNTCVRCDSNLLPHCHCATLESAQILLSDMSWRRPKKLP